MVTGEGIGSGISTVEVSMSMANRGKGEDGERTLVADFWPRAFVEKLLGRFNDRNV